MQGGAVGLAEFVEAGESVPSSSWIFRNVSRSSRR